MNSINNKFSIIIPNYNWWQFLEWCLRSILRQDYLNYEIILIDGKSSDSSHEIIRKYMLLTDKIHWIQKIDKWISNWFNIWLESSSWDFVLYLGSDDYLYDNILEKVNRYVNHITNYGLIKTESFNVFCDSINYWSYDNIFEKRKIQTLEFTKRSLIRYGTLIGLQNMFFNRKWIIENGLDESNKYSMDYAIYFKMIEESQKFLYLPEINSINYQGNNISCKFWYQSWIELTKISLKYASTLMEYFYIFRRYVAIHLSWFISKIIW